MSRLLPFVFALALLVTGCAMVPKYVSQQPPTVENFKGKPFEHSVVLDLNGDGFEDYIQLEAMYDSEHAGTYALEVRWGLARFDRNTISSVITGQRLWLQGVSTFKFVRPPYHPNGYWLVLTAPGIDGEVVLDLTAVDIWKHASLLPHEWVKGFPVKPALAGSSMPDCMRPQQGTLPPAAGDKPVR